MAIVVRRKENEPLSSFLYRATKRIQRSGVLLSARRGRFYKGKQSKDKTWRTAMQRLEMEREMHKFLKQGYPLAEALDRARKMIKGITKK